MLAGPGDHGRPRAHAATTNGEGKFSIASLAPGSYFINAERVGFTMSPFSANGGFNQIALQTGEQSRDIGVKLIPWGAISGRVLDANGAPLDSVSVTAERGHGDQQNVPADEKGQFRIGALRPGKYRLKATRDEMPFPPEVRTDGTVEVHYAATYYPGSTEASSAGRVEVLPGNETSGIEIRMIATPVVGIRGKVWGVPAGATDVEVSDGKERSGPAASDGSFAIWRVDPGRYSMCAYGHTPGGREFRTDRADVEIAGSNADHVDLRVIPAVHILGRLVADDDQAGRKLHPADGRERAGGPIQVVLNELSGSVESPNSVVSGDDSFHLEEVQPGRYQVSVSGIEGAYVNSMRYGQRDIDGAILDLTHGTGAPGDSGTELTLSISSAMGTVSGAVRDDAGLAAGVSVALMEAANEPDGTYNSAWSESVFVTKSKADGTYAFSGLRPGAYKLVAADENTLAPPDLDDYGDLVQDIEIGAGENVSKDLKRRGSGK
jgi:protocatechuate 3,4-dioxygenase beta subunit